MTELWSPIPGFQNYEVSTLGNIRNTVGGRIMSQYTKPDGYKMISFYQRIGVGKYSSKKLRVNRLVGVAFVPNPDNLPEIDHLNRNKTDNRAVNLRWVSRSTNNFNQGIRKDNITGYKGVQPHKYADGLVKYLAVYAGKYIGTYDTIPEAAIARAKHELCIAIKQYILIKG